MSAWIDWGGTDERMIKAMETYAQAVLKAVRQVADYWSPVMETSAKEKAPWVDRTGNARQSLHSWVEELSGDVVALYLAHGVYYGISLERKYAGRYAIIWPTIETHLPQIEQMLKGIFGR